MRSDIITSTATRFFSGFSAFNRLAAKGAKFFVAVMLTVNLSIVFAGVVFRYVFGQPLGWVYEVSIFLMMWSAFVGSAVLTREKSHVSLDFLVLKFPVRMQYLTRIVMEILIMVFLVVTIQASLTMIQGLVALKSAYLRIPMYWVYSSVPVGMGMILFQQMELFINNCIGLFKGETV
ncbi:MAG: TRAP transporter small permease [Desulfotignum sp.]|nr:TRAP transporter small permease [Desulfotignum sp.]